MKIHGEWEISVIRQILIRSTAGVFNREGTLAVFQETQEKAPIQAPWVGLTNAENWEMSGAESLQLFPSMREWAFAHQCQALAVVVPSELKKKIHQTQTGIFSKDQVAYFTRLDAACEWLTQKGFRISPEEYPHAEFIRRTKPQTPDDLGGTPNVQSKVLL
ncbi:hypothetical protein [Undibacterium fentianense]|uniref:Uncharacterized protein n=1 Tax=Undibacterium fentianense TaxID=2828728 RepID=A0A941E4F3_9BURK|nr:hypothetical protein [Undibacterium fentianense]MBR7801336.1 hypothetical protein [Undibacterium fentianense]